MFSDSNAEYIIPADSVAILNEFRYPGFIIPTPAPPTLLDRTTHSIGLKWNEALPYPPGIITNVEIQFLTGKLGRNIINAAELDDALWSSLVTKLYSNSHFTDFTMDYLKPGQVYYFRLRYRCPAGWSEFSPPSEKLTTEPEVPPCPNALTITSISPFAAMVSWEPPTLDNGSAIVEYVLEGKSTGDAFQLLYQGSELNYLVLGLYPTFAYSFRAAAINGVGPSEFSKICSFQAPPFTHATRRRLTRGSGGNGSDGSVPDVPGFSEQQVVVAMQCIQAWHEHWDPRVDQLFYFNTILGIRQLQLPEALAALAREPQNSSSSSSSTSSRHRGGIAQSMGKVKSKHAMDVDDFVRSFRKKRYRLVRALHNRKRSILGSVGGGGSPSRSHTTVESGGAQSSLLNGGGRGGGGGGGGPISLQDGLLLKLQRQKLLQSFCTQLSSFRPATATRSGGGAGGVAASSLLPPSGSSSSAPVHEFLQRFKVQFVGEEGIDAGGLSKEAFLLLSKEFVRYGVHTKKYLRFLEEIPPDAHPTTAPADTAKSDNDANKDEDPAGGVSSRDGRGAASSSSTQNTGPTRITGGLFVTEEHPAAAVAMAPPPSETPSGSGGGGGGGGWSLSRAEFGYWLGVFLGKAIMDRQLVEVPLSLPLLRHLLGQYEHFRATRITPFSALADEDVRRLVQQELRQLDATLAKSLLWMVDNDHVQDVLDETFTVSYDDHSGGGGGGGDQQPQQIPLCARGESTAVTDDNKKAYVYLMAMWKLMFAVTDLLLPLKEGFHSIVPLTALQEAGMTADELSWMLNGKDAIDVEELRAYVLYEGDRDSFHECCSSIVWLWRWVRSLSDAEQRQFLLFFTGSSRVPLDGFDPPLTITDGVDMPVDSLPKAHTCFNQLVLPRYSTYERLQEKLLYAMQNTEGFGLY